MPINTQSLVLGLDDMKIFPLLSGGDTSSSLNYGAAVDIPSIQNISLQHKYTTSELSADEKIADYYVKLASISWSFANAKISLNALAVLEGGTTVLSGTTPNQANTYSVTDPNLPNYFKLEGQIIYSAGTIGDFHLKLYKCKIDNLQVVFQNQNYAIVAASGIAIPTLYNGKVKDYVINETAVSIS